MGYLRPPACFPSECLNPTSRSPVRIDWILKSSWLAVPRALACLPTCTAASISDIPSDGTVKLSESDQKFGNTRIHSSLIVQHSGYWLVVENQPNLT